MNKLFPDNTTAQSQTDATCKR